MSARIVSFQGPDAQVQRFNAVRPEICDTLKCAGDFHLCWIVECEGTKEELLASGFAQPEMFDITTKCGRQSGSDQYGDQYVITRQGKQRFNLERRFRPEATYDIGNNKAWREAEESVTAAVVASLERIAAHSRTRRR